MAQQNKDDSTFDKRIVERNIKRKKISRKDYDQYLKALKDAKGKSVTLLSDEKQSSANVE